MFNNLNKKKVLNIKNFLKENSSHISLSQLNTKFMIFDFVVPIIKKYFSNNKKNLDILEIGSGTGIHSILLSDFGHVHSTDLKLTTETIGKDVEYIRNKLFLHFGNKINYKDNDGENYDVFNKKFDIIFHNSVIEHVTNVSDFNTQINALLKKNGINICITGTSTLCYYRLIRNYIFRLPQIFIFAFLKSVYLTNLYNINLIKIIFKKIKNKYWHFYPTKYLISRAYREYFKSELIKKNRKIDKRILNCKCSLMHIIREINYNRIVLSEISNKLKISERNILEMYYNYFNKFNNELSFNLLPQTHSQHTKNVFSEIKEWKVNNWNNHLIKNNFVIVENFGYRYQHIFGISFNFRHKIFYGIIKKLSKILAIEYSTEFISVSKKKI